MVGTAISVLPWIAPPILGAIIGYVTNWIAIRMLFRPRATKRIFGVQVPLTPGIVPKNRDELAQKIGRAVAGELLSADAIRTQIDSPELQASLGQWISHQRQNLIQQPIRLPGGQQLLYDLMPAISEAIRRLLREPDLRNGMISAGNNIVSNFAANQNAVTGSAIGLSRADRAVINRMPQIIDTIIAEAEAVATPARLAQVTDQWLRTGDAKRVNDFITLSETNEAKIDSYITQRLIAFLREEIPTLSGILNIERLVSERINTFDVVQVERMILEVTGRHLKWINYFGAGLGALIGLTQVVLYVLM